MGWGDGTVGARVRWKRSQEGAVTVTTSGCCGEDDTDLNGTSDTHAQFNAQLLVTRGHGSM